MPNWCLNNEVGECELCEAKGWILTFNVNLIKWTIEKCDLCNIFNNDKEAGDIAYAELVSK